MEILILIYFNTFGNNINLTKLLRNYGFIQLIDKPTHIIRGSMTCIDHIYCNNTNNIKHYGVLDLNLSDHKPIYVIRSKNCYLNKNGNHIIMRYRRWKNIDFHKLEEQINEINLTFDYEEQNLNLLCDQYFSQIHLLQEKFVPIIEKRVKTNAILKWINSEIIKKYE